ncbi:MAG: DOMON domain-containing protein [bacterium]
MKRIFLMVLAALVIVLASISCTTASSPGGAVVNPTPDPSGYYGVTAAGMTFKWKIVGTDLVCELSGPTTGWVAVAFNTTGNMDGSDYVIGYVTGGSNAFIRDDHGSGHSHSADTTQNLTAKSGSESGGTTTLYFTKPLNSGDSQDMTLTQNMTLYIILAYGSNGADDYTSMHSNYGSVHTTLY